MNCYRAAAPGPQDATFAMAMIVIVLVTAGLLYLSLFALPATPCFVNGDVYVLVHEAERMHGGESVYRDFFLIILPGSEILYYALIQIFGPGVALINGTMLVMGVVTACLGLVLSSAVLGAWSALLPCMLFLIFGLRYSLDPTHHIFSLALAFAATALLLRKRDSSRLVASGILCGLAACVTQSVGLAGLAIAAFLLWENATGQAEGRNLLRDETCLLLPFFEVLGTCCAIVLTKFGVTNFMLSIVLFPFKYYDTIWNGRASFSGDFPNGRPPAVVGVWFLSKILMPLVYPVFFIAYWRCSSRSEIQKWAAPMLLAVVGLSLFLTISSAPIWPRVSEVSLPSFILAIWLLARTPVRCATEVILWSVASFALIATPLRTQTRWHGYFRTRYGTVGTIDAKIFPTYLWLSQNISPGEYLFAPASPDIYVLFDVRNPAAMTYMCDDASILPSQVLGVVKDLEHWRPRLIVWTHDMGRIDSKTSAGDSLDPLREYVRSNYHRIEMFPDGTQIWHKQIQGGRTTKLN